MKTLWFVLACLLIPQSIWALSSLEKGIYQNFACYRDLVHSTAELVEYGFYERTRNYLFFQADFETYNTRKVPGLRRDITDAFIDLVARYSTQRPSAPEVVKDSENCRQLKNTIQALPKGLLMEDPKSYAQVYMVSRLEEDERLPLKSLRLASVRELVLSALKKSEDCTLGEMSVFAGLAPVLGVSLFSGGSCRGHGGKHWLIWSPKGYVGLGGGVAGSFGYQNPFKEIGWSQLYRANFQTTGFISGGTGVGAYYTPTRGLTKPDGGGVSFGTPYFLFAAIGASLRIKVLFLGDDDEFILRSLGL